MEHHEDPLDDPLYVYTNASSIDPELLRDRSSSVIAAYFRRLNEDYGSPGLGRKEQHKICLIIQEETFRGLTKEEIEEAKERSRGTKEEVEEEARRAEEEEKNKEPPSDE